ncbi:putative F-box domain-containing protein [Tanacetum coccineum]
MAEVCMPDEILDNILARLPGKSLLRSRCVSKHWNRLISDPCFMKLRSRQMILFGYPWPLVVIDDNVPVEDKAHSMLKIPSLLEYTIVYIVGTFSGLVILVFTDMLSRGHMILYNPLTRASKTLAVMDPPSNRYLPYVFGFDTNELKVVRFEFINHPTQGRIFKCDVFHLKTSLWSTPPRYFKQDFYFWIGEGDEIDHCGISCPRVLPVWRKVWSWWNLPSPVVFPSFSVADVAMGRIDSFGGSRMNKVLHGVLQCTLWSIWKWRNRITHADLDVAAKIKEEDIFPGIQRVSKTWISARLKAYAPNWDAWISRSFNLFLIPVTRI